MCVLVTLDLRYTFPRTHLLAELGKMPGSQRLHQIHCFIKQGCVTLRHEWKCFSEATFTVMESRTADRNAAETTIIVCAAKTRLKIPTAGHQRKHNACRAEIKGCVSGYTHFSRDTTRVSQIVLVP